MLARRAVLVLFLLSLTLPACGGNGSHESSAAAPDGSFAVGETSFVFVDTTRPTAPNHGVPGKDSRTLRTVVYYPATGNVGDPSRIGAPRIEGRRFPLIVFAHGGGFIPYAPGRVDRNSEAERRDRLASKIQARVSEYLDRFYFDTCLYDPVMLYTLSQRVGPDRLIMGSDYPVGDLDPVGFVERERTLGESERRGILGQTASRLLKIGA